MVYIKQMQAPLFMPLTLCRREQHAFCGIIFHSPFSFRHKFAAGTHSILRPDNPIKTSDHDWAKEKAAPFGIFDIANYEGYINVGISSDTAEFAVNSIREWWYNMGSARYPEATCLYITCDGGGSNGSRNRLWKKELQNFANELGIAIQVSHFPPGTSKWNKIEHQLFSQITKNWRGQPLDSYLTIITISVKVRSKSK